MKFWIFPLRNTVVIITSGTTSRHVLLRRRLIPRDVRDPRFQFTTTDSSQTSSALFVTVYISIIILRLYFCAFAASISGLRPCYTPQVLNQWKPDPENRAFDVGILLTCDDKLKSLVNRVEIYIVAVPRSTHAVASLRNYATATCG